MNNLTLYFTMLMVALVMACSPESKKTNEDSVAQDSTGFVSLFNGKDFSGWEFYLGIPHPSVEVTGLAKNDEGKYTEPIGAGKDSLEVFRIVEIDGAPALRISGQINGSFATTNEYENYHFKVDQKWGETKWPSAGDRPRNSGLLYHGVGEFGLGLGVWKIAHECQVMEGMFGDSYRMGDTFCKIKVSGPDENGKYTYDPNGESILTGHTDECAHQVVSKNPGNEKPLGEWNTIEVICFGDKSIHIVNGKVNMVNTDSYIMKDSVKVTLTKGVIQLQSEGSEVYYRGMAIKLLEEVPNAYKQYF